MASAFASQVFSRRHLIQAMAGAIGVTDETAMRRPGKAPLLEEKSLPQTTAATPPGPVRWLQKATFGFTQGDYTAFYSLPGANDDLRWQSCQQL